MADNLWVLLGHPDFRGLWVSQCTERGEGGELITEEGWSVTFVKDGRYHDLYYQPTPEKAVEAALDMMSDNGR